MAEIQLTPHENLAFNLLRNSPDILHQLTKGTGQITISDLHGFYGELDRHLKFSYQKRKEDFVETTATRILEEA